MRVIGLTGGIASGKSTVSQLLAKFGAIVIDADKVGHEIFQPGTDVWREVVAAFGDDILDENRAIDRKRLGEKVFGSQRAMSRLNGIMHPKMFENVRARIEEYRKQGVSTVILEATLLIEAGWRPLVDEVWLTIAPEPVILRRLRERGGFSESDALARVRSQIPPEERLRHADIVINTDCTLSELEGKVRELWKLKFRENAQT